MLAQWDPNVRWNGWLCPSIDPLSVVNVLDTINSENGTPVYLYDWTEEGYLMLVELQDEDSGVEFLQPDEDGLYSLGSHAWIWSEERRVIGVFRAVSTRDASGLARDGEPYMDMNLVEEADRRGLAEGGDLFEVQFLDGQWMLVRAIDLI